MQKWTSPLTSAEFEKCADLLSCIRSRDLKVTINIELNQYAGTVQNESERKKHEELSAATIVIIDIATAKGDTVSFNDEALSLMND